MSSKITSSSTAEYFSKNLQQVGFSSATKAVLTTLKEAVDNSLDACEENEILPSVNVLIEKAGSGTQKNTDLVRIVVTDNGPGIEVEDLPRVYGEYLASSKFGRGRCSRGQQGIGISAATTWAQLTSAKGVRVITKTSRMRSAVSALVEVDIKKNQGVLKDKETIDWDRPHGTSVEFYIDGRIQLNGEGGILTYLTGTSLVNPHLTLNYKINDEAPVSIPRVTETLIPVPEAVAPHPHTMKLGEFLSHVSLFGKVTLETFLKKGFSRVGDSTFPELVKAGVKKAWFSQALPSLDETALRTTYSALQAIELMPPSTRSVLSIGEEGLSQSVNRLGELDFFSVVSRKPRICDAKPVVVEVAIARLLKSQNEADDPVTVLRFANRVPLQFDKAACAIVRAIESVNWRAYGLQQPKNSIPQGPYVIAVSVVSPFIKFKNASKETIDASDELVDELRLALIQAGQRLSRHINKERRAADLEEKIRHIEQFGPILISCIGRIVKAPETRLQKARDGLMKILGRDAERAENDLALAEEKHAALEAKQKKKKTKDEDDAESASEDAEA
ncbi:MAG: DNA topoisomerase VI subunit B [Bdellovibrionales bacterium]|nr:DNA topoisomerase VI subunit B [Bdellovibrionales bacterium]